MKIKKRNIVILFLSHLLIFWAGFVLYPIIYPDDSIEQVAQVKTVIKEKLVEKTDTLVVETIKEIRDTIAINLSQDTIDPLSSAIDSSQLSDTIWGDNSLSAFDEGYQDSSIYADLPIDTIEFIEEDIPAEEPEAAIEIARETLLASFKIKLIKAQKAIVKNDTLLEQLTGSAKNELDQNIFVEYWKSPLNYKGYKFANNKLVLFGVKVPETSGKLFLINDNYFYQNANDYYRIEKTFDFKAFEQISETSFKTKWAGGN